MNQPHHFLQRFKLMKLFPVFGSPGHTFNIGRRVASHFPNGHLFALKRPALLQEFSFRSKPHATVQTARGSHRRLAPASVRHN